MFLKGKTEEEYSGFGKRLFMAATAKGFSETRDLAEALDAKCHDIVQIREKKRNAKPVDPLSKIIRNIQLHLNTEDAYEIPSQYLYSYSLLLDCSLDYLYGRSKIMSSDLTVADMCEKTGLSEAAIINLVENVKNCSDPDSFSFSAWWSELLSNSNFMSIPSVWYDYASRIVQLYDIDKKISAKQRAVKSEELSDFIMKLIYEDEDQKTLKLIRREKEDSTLGAYNKMMMHVDNILNKYADEWALKQHPQYDEMYYRSEINKLQILNGQLKV